MNLLQESPNQIFPFPVDANELQRGKTYDLYGGNPVSVVDRTKRTLTLRAEEGHWEGEGSIITFQTSTTNDGRLKLNVSAHNVAIRPVEESVIRGTLTDGLWALMAHRINVVLPDICSPSVCGR